MMDMMVTPGGFEFGYSEPEIGIVWKKTKTGNWTVKYNGYRVTVGGKGNWFTIYKYEMRCLGMEEAIRKNKPKKMSYRDFITEILEDHLSKH